MLDFGSHADYYFIDKLYKKKCRVPNVHCISMNCFNSGEPSISNFLTYCMPVSFSGLCINMNNSVTNSPVDFYRKALERAIRLVKKEVFLFSVRMNSSTLETIVKAATKADKLIFSDCQIDASSDLDFSSTYEYK